MDAASRESVRRRAGDRCEYCQVRQDDEPFFRFQIEHIVAKQHGGSDSVENLALACPRCNLHKGPNVAGIDPDTGVLTPLFHPRTQRWEDHFVFDSAEGAIHGQTPVGRVTVHVLNMNHPLRRAARSHRE